MLQLLVTLAAGVVGYFLARNFVSRRLRFVDAVHSPFAPIVAGSAAALLTWPAALLPFITFTTTLVFGIGTGLGTASGSRALKHSERQRRLAP
jgi:CHASE2 domain-containing sensor protein